jgi:Na+-transporting NADH:ubiquinone oxidoreductase subunit D
MRKSEIFINSAFKDNSVWRQILGICSALAVTNLMINSLVMGLGVIFTLAMSGITISLIGKYTPRRVRMMVQTLVIASYVIMVDIFLKAYYPEMSRALGPYVGLIITNCIIMGRAEAFAQKNNPMDSFVDGVATGVGYTLVLLVIAFIRELFGFGSLFGFQVLGDWWVSWSIMVMAPSAFFVLGLMIWFINNRYYIKAEEKQ